MKKYHYLKGVAGYFLLGGGVASLINHAMPNTEAWKQIVVFFLIIVGGTWILEDAKEELEAKILEREG